MSNTQQEIATPDNKNTRSRIVRSRRLTFGTTKWLTYTAVFAVLAIVLKLTSQFTDFGIFKLTLIYTIWLIAAATLGVLGGGAVCFVSDILISLVFPKGPLIPFITIGNTLFGVVAALVFKYTPSKSYAVRLIVSGIAATLVCTCGINSVAMYYCIEDYRKLFATYWTFFFTSRIWQLLVAAINIGITVSMIPLLKKLNLLPDISKKKKGKDEQNA